MSKCTASVKCKYLHNAACRRYPETIQQFKIHIYIYKNIRNIHSEEVHLIQNAKEERPKREQSDCECSFHMWSKNSTGKWKTLFHMITCVRLIVSLCKGLNMLSCITVSHCPLNIDSFQYSKAIFSVDKSILFSA